MTLTAVRSALLEELNGDDSRLHFINTRLILTVGVNLNGITPAVDEDNQKIESAISALRSMGFLLSSANRESDDG